MTSVSDEQVEPGRMRNVVLVGHGGTGKTTLAETLLAAGGVADGRGGVLDFDAEERRRGHSLGLSMGSLWWRDHRVTVLDTPGSPEACGDAYPALVAADVAVFVVDATLGVQPQHDDLWGACELLGLPRLVVLNKLDKRNASYQTHVDALRERYGRPLAPVHMPIGVGEQFTGVIDLLHATAVTKGPDGRVETTVPDERAEQAAVNRELLVEAIVENDDGLLERYLEGEVPDADELASVFARGIAGCGFYPVLCASATEDIGGRLLLDFLVDECPSSADRPLGGAALDGPAAVYVAKTFSDPYVGRINVLRVAGGTVRRDDQLTCTRTGTTVRLHQLVDLCGKEQQPLPVLYAGMIGAVAKLDDVRTGDVLCAPGVSLKLEVPQPPAPYHRVALEPASVGDEDKLSSALSRLADEDPSLRLELDTETKQLVLHSQGPTHVDVVLERLERKFGVSVRLVPLRLRYRETLRRPAEALGRHVKQSGGHGQYGIAQVRLEPLPRGAGYEFESKVVGGAIPTQYLGSVDKGVREAMAQGVLAGYPVVDVHATVLDGKFHSVDSSDMAFQLAGSLAFRNAAEEAGVVLLEPILLVEVSAPTELLGDIMGDLSSRRGRIQGTEQTVAGRSTVTALVPEGELLSYVPELRSLTSGTGTVRMRYDHHEEVPDSLVRKVVEQSELAKA